MDTVTESDTDEWIRAAFELAPHAIVCADARGRIVRCNPRAEDLFGYASGELIGRSLAELHAPADHADFPAGFERMQRAGRHDAELPMRRKDGAMLWVALTARRLPDGSSVGFIEDLTAHRLEERRVAAILETAQDGVLTFDDKQQVVMANRAAETLFGVGPGELLGRSLRALLPERFRAAHTQLAADAYQAHTANARRDVTGLHASGREIPIEVSLSRVEVAGRQLITAIVRDTAERNQMLTALRASEDRFAQVFRSLHAGLVLVSTVDMRVMEANDAYLRIAGLTREEAVGQPYADVALPAEPAELERFAALFARDGQIVDELYRFRRRDGTTGTAMITARAVELASERCLLAVVTDVSARVAAEDALRVTVQRFHDLADNIREVFWLADPETSEIYYLSPGWVAIWGPFPEDARARRGHWLASIHPDDRSRVVHDLAGRQARGEYEEEYRVVRPDGSVRWVHAQAYPVRDPSGRVVRIAGIAEDITRRRELEAQLRQTQKLESIGLLAGGVAHDFNNWLTVIGASVEMLADLHRDADALEYLQEIRLAAERASALTRQLLAFSRRDVVEPRVLDLNDVVRDTQKILGRVLGEDIALRTQLDPFIDPINADPGHMTQVLMNLAVNARDAMPRGGALALSTSRLVRDDRRFVRLAVEDSGTGMTPAVLARIFEPFFTTKGLGVGTGLGLAVVHGIVAQLGGAIEVASEPGAGTRFHVDIPAHSSTDAPAAAARMEAPRGHERVLVVEDEASVRRVALRVLQRQGYEVIAAASGHEALAAIAQHSSVDLVLTDVVMPGMDGLEVAQAVRARFPHVKVLFTSGYTDDALTRHGVARDALEFLAKPYTSQALLRKVREALDG